MVMFWWCFLWSCGGAFGGGAFGHGVFAGSAGVSGVFFCGFNAVAVEFQF